MDEEEYILDIVTENVDGCGKLSCRECYPAFVENIVFASEQSAKIRDAIEFFGGDEQEFWRKVIETILDSKEDVDGNQ